MRPVFTVSVPVVFAPGLIAAAAPDACRVWEFGSRKLVQTFALGSPITLLRMQRANGLLAVASDDLALRVFDLEAKTPTLVRHPPATRAVVECAGS